jgi:hypothetical protein
MQKASPPPLLPLLRSRPQAEVLTLVLLNPGQEWSLTSLASHTGTSVSWVQREITRAEQAGVVSSRRLGNVRLVRAADSPLTDPLTELLLRSFGPRQVLAEELQDVEGLRPTSRGGHIAVQDAVIAQFGSSIRALRSFSRLRRARNNFEYPSTETPGPSEDDVKDATRVAREVNDAADKILESGILSPW